MVRAFVSVILCARGSRVEFRPIASDSYSRLETFDKLLCAWFRLCVCIVIVNKFGWDAGNR